MVCSKCASTSAPEARLAMPALVPTASLLPLASSRDATPYQAEGWCSRTKG